MKKIKRNFIYNISYQILILIIPFITTPYIARVIGVEGVGINSYTYSIAYYFMTFSLLGINTYGNRLIAKIRDDKEKMSKEFCSLYVIQIITTTIMIILYYIYIMMSESQYKQIAIIQGIFIFSALFDINWFFQGLENFKLIVVRNAIIKLITIILIFIFVKEINDLWKYIMILSVGTVFSQIILFRFLKKYIKIVKVTINDIKKHIKPIIILFVPVIAITFYKVMDKIMLGNLASIIDVGYYENAEKIINVPMSIITAIGAVMLPNISNIISKGNETKVKKYLYIVIRVMYFMVIPMALGIVVIAKDFVSIYLGDEFISSAIILQVLAISLIFSSISNVIRTQYLIPKEQDKQYIISIIIGAVINFILNIILIKYLRATGAALATLIAEIIVTTIQINILRKQIKIKYILKMSIKYIIASCSMFLICSAINLININLIIKMLIEIILGITLYIGILVVMKDKFTKDIIKSIKRKVSFYKI